jgi:hypothetical protein
VSNSDLADVATDTIKGRSAAGTGSLQDLTALPFAFTGDVTRPVDSNVQTIAADAVTSAKILDGTIATGDIGDSQVTLAKIANIANNTVLGNTSGSSSAPSELSTTGSGSVVLATSPTLVTPVLGVATATTINKVTLTAPSTGSTLTVADGKTLTANNSLTLAGADSTTLTFQGTGTVVNRDSTDTLTGKTIDAAATGNTLKFKSYLQLTVPHLCDGAGAVIATNDYTQIYYGHALFSGTAATNANFVEYRLQAPDDLDTSVDLKAKWKVRLNGADTSASTYTIGMASVADSASAAGSLANHVTLAVSADASGASGDVETTASTTLTGWAAALTPGALWVIRVARDGANDTSNVAHYDMGLVIEYGVTQ